MFITLEGIEGSGKTTQIKHLAEYLKGRGRQCVSTREPGGTAIGTKIRSILLDPASRNMVPQAELLLYLADRAQHIQTVIEPALAGGKMVLCDRFFDATVVYQGYARQLDVDFIRRLHELLFQGLTPALTLLLDLPPRIGLSRAWKQLDNGQRTGEESRFEEEKMIFHEKVRSGYLELARLEPERIRVVDAARGEAAVREDIFAILDGLLERTGR